MTFSVSLKLITIFISMQVCCGTSKIPSYSEQIKDNPECQTGNAAGKTKTAVHTARL